MKRVIEGKAYNTETATYVCDVSCNTEARSIAENAGLEEGRLLAAGFTIEEG